MESVSISKLKIILVNYFLRYNLWFSSALKMETARPWVMFLTNRHTQCWAQQFRKPRLISTALKTWNIVFLTC